MQRTKRPLACSLTDLLTCRLRSLAWQFLTRLQLLPYKSQQSVLRSFTTKIKQTDDAMASQLESSSIKVVSEKAVFENPRNDAEKVRPEAIIESSSSHH